MDLRDVAMILNAQPTTALLSEGTSAELFFLKSQLRRWLDLTERELIQRYPVMDPATPLGEPA